MGKSVVEVADAPATSAQSVCVGQLTGMTALGEPLVDFAGNAEGPIPARVVATAGLSDQSPPGTEVLLAFDSGDPGRPIVVGILAAAPRHGPLATGVLREMRPGEVTVDGRTITLQAEQRMVLSCGKSSITLFADGRVIVKGTKLVSRASESNKIKGATIALN